MKKVILLIVFLLQLQVLNTAQAIRLKDIADVEGVRGNDLIGYGLVIGLKGTGDKGGMAFTNQSMANMLERMGIRVNSKDLKLQNVAAVMVTAKLPAFARPGMNIDVNISSIGDAQTLQGGVLTLTALKGPDGQVYAVAQGPLAVGGFSMDTPTGDTIMKNHPTVGFISKGATVEKAVPFDLFASGQVRIMLKHPDFVTAIRIQDAINANLGKKIAKAMDNVSVVIPLEMLNVSEPVKFISAISQVEVIPDTEARVVINEKTGTIIMGENVRISTVAIAHGNLNINVQKEVDVVQPAPFSDGETVVVENQRVSAEEEAGQLMLMKMNKSVQLADVVKALNALGATPRDLMAILEALKKSGAMHAELVVM
ncbi:MAG: flagellar basal body P-ring protein FlgI [Deltaproteobacteria bacterium]|jgi:flagellar P-ring protein precursor FlgI|nr:flagellar basal body P-ring protein FlgI [Deltaproteobacteria bacterium]